MFKGKFSITGGKEVAELLRKVPQVLGEKMMRGASFDSAVVVRDAVRKFAPRNEGRLEHFIGRTALYDRRRNQVIARVGVVLLGRGARRAKALAKMKLSAGVDYASFVNEGTKFQKAQKFFQRGFNSSVYDFTSRYVERMNARIEKHYRTTLARR